MTRFSVLQGSENPSGPAQSQIIWAHLKPSALQDPSRRLALPSFWWFFFCASLLVSQASCAWFFLLSPWAQHAFALQYSIIQTFLVLFIMLQKVWSWMSRSIPTAFNHLAIVRVFIAMTHVCRSSTLIAGLLLLWRSETCARTHSLESNYPIQNPSESELTKFFFHRNVWPFARTFENDWIMRKTELTEVELTKVNRVPTYFIAEG